MGASTRTKRAYGTGSLITRHGSWYGQWRVGGRLVKRKLGAQRTPGDTSGLTRTQAEKELRRLMQELDARPVDERLTIAEAGERYLRHVEHVLERRPTTVADYGSVLRRHLAPFFGQRRIDQISADDFTAYLARKSKEGLSSKTVSNHLSFAHGLFGFALKRRWISANPVLGVDRPRYAGFNPDIRFLDRSEVEALVRAVPDDLLGPTDRALYVTAAMAGLRQGELFALRWCDVDRPAGVVRIRRSITRGRLGAPKSRRSSRAVPMADRVARELEQHFQGSNYQGDEELVFAHPETGRFYDPSRSRKRFKAALAAAGLRPLRFHDLRHTYGTAMAGAGVPMRTLQEWMGHRDYSTTLIYADYSPSPGRERAWTERAFGEVVPDEAVGDPWPVVQRGPGHVA